jgi:hypothetical protein
LDRSVPLMAAVLTGMPPQAISQLAQALSNNFATAIARWPFVRFRRARGLCRAVGKIGSTMAQCLLILRANQRSSFSLCDMGSGGKS